MAWPGRTRGPVPHGFTPRVAPYVAATKVWDLYSGTLPAWTERGHGQTDGVQVGPAQGQGDSLEPRPLSTQNRGKGAPPGDCGFPGACRPSLCFSLLGRGCLPDTLPTNIRPSDNYCLVTAKGLVPQDESYPKSHPHLTQVLLRSRDLGLLSWYLDETLNLELLESTEHTVHVGKT